MIEERDAGVLRREAESRNGKFCADEPLKRSLKGVFRCQVLQYGKVEPDDLIGFVAPERFNGKALKISQTKRKSDSIVETRSDFPKRGGRVKRTMPPQAQRSKMSLVLSA